MDKVVLKSNGLTFIVKNGLIVKKHFTTHTDINFYKNQGLRVEIESMNIRNKRRTA